MASSTIQWETSKTNIRTAEKIQFGKISFVKFKSRIEKRGPTSVSIKLQNLFIRRLVMIYCVCTQIRLPNFTCIAGTMIEFFDYRLTNRYSVFLSRPRKPSNLNENESKRSHLIHFFVSFFGPQPDWLREFYIEVFSLFVLIVVYDFYSDYGSVKKFFCLTVVSKDSPSHPSPWLESITK